MKQIEPVVFPERNFRKQEDLQDFSIGFHSAKEMTLLQGKENSVQNVPKHTVPRRPCGLRRDQ